MTIAAASLLSLARFAAASGLEVDVEEADSKTGVVSTFEVSSAAFSTVAVGSSFDDALAVSSVVVDAASAAGVVLSVSGVAVDNTTAGAG